MYWKLRVKCLLKGRNPADCYVLWNIFQCSQIPHHMFCRGGTMKLAVHVLYILTKQYCHPPYIHTLTHTSHFKIAYKIPRDTTRQ